jgi:arylsulfatase A-like enzyme
VIPSPRPLPLILLATALAACGAPETPGPQAEPTEPTAVTPAPHGSEAPATAQAQGPLTDREALLQQLALAGLDAPPAAPFDPPGDVLLVVLDTLRRDRVGQYPPQRDTTPRLDAWAAGARIYEQARSVSSWTLPAHVSLFTGQYPSQHHVHYMPPDQRKPGGPEAYGLRPGTPTLAGALARQGYITFGVSANQAYLSPYWNTLQGFEGFISGQIEPDERCGYPSAERITSLALEVLEQPRERPLFLFLNYMDAHKPPVLRPEFVRHPERIPDPPILPGYPGWDEVAERVLALQEPLPEPIAAAWNEAYDAEVRYLDAQLGRLLEALPGLGIDHRDLVVILADHGENLGEHALLLHGRDVYETTIAIPLLAAGPGFEPGRDPTPVQILDVPRWILDFVGAPALPGMASTAGVQLAQQFWSRSADLQDERLRRRFDRVRYAVTRGTHKLLHGSDGSLEAYDLAADPDERAPLPDAPWVEALQAFQAPPAGEEQPVGHQPDRELSPAQIEQLRILGYLD